MSHALIYLASNGCIPRTSVAASRALAWSRKELPYVDRDLLGILSSSPRLLPSSSDAVDRGLRAEALTAPAPAGLEKHESLTLRLALVIRGTRFLTR